MVIWKEEGPQPPRLHVRTSPPTQCCPESYKFIVIYGIYLKPKRKKWKTNTLLHKAISVSEISHTYCMTYKAAYLARVGTVRALRLKFVFGLSQSAVAHPGCHLLVVSSRSFLRPTEIKLLVIHSFAFPKRKCWWLWRWWLSDAQCRTWCWSRTQTCNLRT